MSWNSECDMSPKTSHKFYFGPIATLIEYLAINDQGLGLILLCACVYTYIVWVLDNKLFFRIVGAEQLNLGFAVFHAACLLVQISVRKPYTHTHTHFRSCAANGLIHNLIHINGVFPYVLSD